MSKPFPFSAIVAQQAMKQALLMAAVEPLLGGVLIFGDRGTGKSTAVRALAELLPKIETRQGCRYNCLPNEPQEACPVCTPHKGAKPPPVVNTLSSPCTFRMTGAAAKSALAAVVTPGMARTSFCV